MSFRVCCLDSRAQVIGNGSGLSAVPAFPAGALRSKQKYSSHRRGVTAIVETLAENAGSSTDWDQPTEAQGSRRRCILPSLRLCISIRHAASTSRWGSVGSASSSTRQLRPRPRGHAERAGHIGHGCVLVLRPRSSLRCGSFAGCPLLTLRCCAQATYRAYRAPTRSRCR